MRSSIASMLAAAFLLAAGQAQAAGIIRITEWMYNTGEFGDGNGEFVELTNVGTMSIDLTGWAMDDSRGDPSEGFDLSGFGIVEPGESVIITESSESDFRTGWSLPASVKILGGLGSVGDTKNFGGDDTINIYDASDALVDILEYGDGDFDGSIKTHSISGNPMTPAALGANDVYQWQLSYVGDPYGSYTSAGGDVGNPGSYTAVPEPASLTLVIFSAATIAVYRRRRK